MAEEFEKAMAHFRAEADGLKFFDRPVEEMCREDLLSVIGFYSRQEPVSAAGQSPSTSHSTAATYPIDQPT